MATVRIMVIFFICTLCLTLFEVTDAADENVRSAAALPDAKMPKNNNRRWRLLAEECRQPVPYEALANVSDFTNENCSHVFYFYDLQNESCTAYFSCSTSPRKTPNSFASLKTCLDTCIVHRQPKKARCRPRRRIKAPARCRWVRSADADGCSRYQLQCIGGPCSTGPCKSPCEICVYNLEYTVRNCTHDNSANGSEECALPYRCERDVRCDSENISTSSLNSTLEAIETIFVNTSRLRFSFNKESESGNRGNTPWKPTAKDLFVAPFINESITNSCFVPAKFDGCPTGTYEEYTATPRWYFDTHTKICRQFYGQTCGTHKSSGLFRTKEECFRICLLGQDCPSIASGPIPPTCRHEERLTVDGCMALALVCAEKPGRCPLPTGKPNHICYKECEKDYDCKGDMKCCANGCATLCLLPAPAAVSRENGTALMRLLEVGGSTNVPSKYIWINAPQNTSVDTIAEGTDANKPGNCPKEKRRPSGGACSNNCQNDTDCPDAKKCCSSNGCGKVCRTPVTRSVLLQTEKNPCSKDPCQLRERCIPTLDSYHCEPLIDDTIFDPCAAAAAGNRSNPCSPSERCVYEPKICITSPCTQYRCVPIRKSDKTTSGIKRRIAASVGSYMVPHDPCLSNPCRPCEKCVWLTSEQNRTEADDDCKEYRCENNCPGSCEECHVGGRCVKINQPYVCRVQRANDPCKNRACPAYPEATCEVDPCHCLRAYFILPSKVKLHFDRCSENMTKSCNEPKD